MYMLESECSLESPGGGGVLDFISFKPLKSQPISYIAII